MQHREQDILDKFDIEAILDDTIWKMEGCTETVYDEDGNVYSIACVLTDDGRQVEASARIDPPRDCALAKWGGSYGSVNEALHAWYAQLITPGEALDASGFFRNLPELDISALAASGLYD